MPVTPRIQSESTRRLVLAGLMFLILFLAMVVAWLLTEARNPSIDLADRPVQLGVFEVTPPAGWEIASASDVTQRSDVVLLREGQGRSLFIQELVYAETHPPAEALAQLLRRLPAGQIQPLRPAQPFRGGGYTGLLFEAASFQDQQQITHFLLVFTLDGQRYLALHLRRLGPPTPADHALLQTVARTVADQRYLPVLLPEADSGNLSVPLPEELLAFRDLTAETDQVLLIVPSTSEQFFALRFRSLPTIPPAGATEEEQALPSGARPAALLARQYWEIHHQLPDENDFAQDQIAGRTVTTIGLIAERELPIREELWHIHIDDQHTALMQVTAPFKQTSSARRTALWLASRIEPKDTQTPAGDPWQNGRELVAHARQALASHLQENKLQRQSFLVRRDGQAVGFLLQQMQPMTAREVREANLPSSAAQIRNRWWLRQPSGVILERVSQTRIASEGRVWDYREQIALQNQQGEAIVYQTRVQADEGQLTAVYQWPGGQTQLADQADPDLLLPPNLLHLVDWPDLTQPALVLTADTLLPAAPTWIRPLDDPALNFPAGFPMPETPVRSFLQREQGELLGAITVMDAQGQAAARRYQETASSLLSPGAIWLEPMSVEQILERFPEWAERLAGETAPDTPRSE